MRFKCHILLYLALFHTGRSLAHVSVSVCLCDMLCFQLAHFSRKARLIGFSCDFSGLSSFNGYLHLINHILILSKICTRLLLHSIVSSRTKYQPVLNAFMISQTALFLYFSGIFKCICLIGGTIKNCHITCVLLS